MGKTIPVQIGSVPTKVAHTASDNLHGEEFKPHFPRNVPTVITMVNMKLTAPGETATITMSVNDREGNSRIINQEYSSGGFFAYFDKHINLGPDEYLSISTTGMGSGCLVEIVGQIVSM